MKKRRAELACIWFYLQPQLHRKSQKLKNPNPSTNRKQERSLQKSTAKRMSVAKIHSKQHTHNTLSMTKLNLISLFTVLIPAIPAFFGLEEKNIATIRMPNRNALSSFSRINSRREDAGRLMEDTRLSITGRKRLCVTVVSMTGCMNAECIAV